MVGAWVRLLINSAVVAAVAVAAQLGAGGVLGILAWDGPHDARGWTTLLSWVSFCYAVAVVAGALAGRGAMRRHRQSHPDGRSGDGVGTRLTASLVAAGGTASVIGLAWLPSAQLQPPVNVNPGLVISLTAGAGVVVGLLLALLATTATPIAAGVRATVAWVWLVAIGCAVVGLTSNEPYPAPRPGVPDAPSLLPDSAWAGPRVMVAVAVLVGLLCSGIARARGAGRLGAALSGFGGPALVAAAYLVAGPGSTENVRVDDEPYLLALIAAAAGLVASVLVAMPGRRAAPPPPPIQAETGPLQGEVIETVRTPTSTENPRRPAWAGGSGPFARAYTSPAPARASVPAQPAREPVTLAATTRGTGWDADTLPGTTSNAGAGGRHAHEESLSSGGTYRGAATGDPVDQHHESWLRDVTSHGGRHAALD